MNIQWVKKNVLPHVVALATFYLLTIVYFSPVFFENKDLMQGDVTSYIGWGNDVRQYYDATGEYCYWSNAMFGGMPSNYAFPSETNNIFDKIDSLFKGFLAPNTAGAFFVYLIGFYCFMLAIGCSPVLSVIGAIAYSFASYNLIIIDAGHVSKAYVMATMAPVIGGVILCYRGKYLAGILMTLIFTGLNVFWNHQQISYYLIIMLFVLAVVYLIYAVKEHTLPSYFKSSAVLVIVALLAAAPAVDKLLPTMDYSKESMRGGAVLKSNADGEKESTGLDIDYAYQWSYGKMETMTLLIPNFYGASSHYNIGRESQVYDVLKQTGQGEQFCRYAPMYWGDQPFTSGPVYVGAIVCFLFVLGLIVVKGKEKWWLLAVTVIALILSWGRNFAVVNDFLFHYLPLYNKFRTPSMALVIAEVSMVTLAMLAVKQMMEDEDRRKYVRPLYISAGVVGGISLLFALFGGSMFSFTADADANYPDWLRVALEDDRKSLLKADAWRSFFFFFLGFVVIFLFISKKIKPVYMLCMTGLLILVDLWGVDKRFLNNDSFIPKRQAKKIEPTAIDNLILQDKDPDYRVLNLATNTFNESRTSYFHKSIGGYSPAKLRRYQDIIDYHISRDITPNVLDMLNTRYIIYNANGRPQVQKNPDAMGNAWFVDGIRWMDTPDDEILALKDENLHSVALMDKEWKSKITDEAKICNKVDSSAYIRLKDYVHPGNLVYEASTPTPQLAVFSEVFYKTWKVFIDGDEVPLLRANYILRAVEVPAGNHEIEFKCVDELYEKAHIWSLVFSIVAVVVFLGVMGLIVYRMVKDNNNTVKC